MEDRQGHQRVSVEKEVTSVFDVPVDDGCSVELAPRRDAEPVMVPLALQLTQPDAGVGE